MELLPWSSTLIDELGYLSYDARAADLIFQLVSRRYEHRSLLITTNLPFKRQHVPLPARVLVPGQLFHPRGQTDDVRPPVAIQIRHHRLVAAGQFTVDDVGDEARLDRPFRR